MQLQWWLQQSSMTPKLRRTVQLSPTLGREKEVRGTGLPPTLNSGRNRKLGQACMRVPYIFNRHGELARRSLSQSQHTHQAWSRHDAFALCKRDQGGLPLRSLIPYRCHQWNRRLSEGGAPAAASGERQRGAGVGRAEAGRARRRSDGTLLLAAVKFLAMFMSLPTLDLHDMVTCQIRGWLPRCVNNLPNSGMIVYVTLLYLQDIGVAKDPMYM
ncbi:hypothetical protein AXF42_Ash007780 [Apostasia shenzhenica]|uniref:Uncharacterized protein n=1 Tax=Apostasia shenzhenica TaxID=1088818 RepID=A0A2I0B5B3_9ASPA|nr:hypothetical protein AXF42_Ash007780 [Apostasia shenzhenica]